MHRGPVDFFNIFLEYNEWIRQNAALPVNHVYTENVLCFGILGISPLLATKIDDS
jgi:hypothetical protein